MLTKPHSCNQCVLYDTGFGHVPGEGSAGAPIMFIGEAAGEVEHNEGRPFRGGTGKMLRMMIHQAGLEPHHYFISNVVQCRPPKNRTPTFAEISYCTERYLAKELAYVKPRIIVPVGDVAFSYVLPHVIGGITTCRGYTFTTAAGQTVIPIVHPSFVARGNREFWAITVSDLRKVKLAMEGRLPAAPNENFIINPSIADVRLIAQMILSKGLRFAFDIETIGQREKLNLLCNGFAWSPEDALCIPFLSRGGHTYWKSETEEEEAWYWHCELLSSSNMKVGQNIFTFDIPVLEWHKIKVNPPARDTLIRHHCIGLELPHSLAFLTSVYTSMPYYKMAVKNAGGMLWAPDDILRTYNLRDCIATYQADMLISEEMVELGLLSST